MTTTIGLAGQQHARSGRAGGLPLAVSCTMSGAAPAAGISVCWLLVVIWRACSRPAPPGRALVPARRGPYDSGRMAPPAQADGPLRLGSVVGRMQREGQGSLENLLIHHEGESEQEEDGKRQHGDIDHPLPVLLLLPAHPALYRR